MKNIISILTSVFLVVVFHAPTQSQTVYATKTGAKYHTSSCRYASSGYPVSLSDAKGKGLSPCSVCKPSANEEQTPANNAIQSNSLKSETPVSESQSQTVYATRTGTKYHLSSCRYASSGYPVSLKDAKGKGLSPCSVCKPSN